MQKTFFNLVQEVQKKGKCSHCGGCVTFCSAINYGALELDEDGKPRFGNMDKCIECGLCYSICPQTNELDDEIREKAHWQEPLGKVINFNVTRARDEKILDNGTDGGVVTAILTYLFDTGRIDGAIVSKNTPQGRIPCLAKTRQEILSSAGSHFNSSQAMLQFGKEYSTFSPSISALGGLRFHSLDRLAFVGTPCQIVTIRKMQAMNMVPSDVIILCLGLFCSGNFTFSEPCFKPVSQAYGFDYEDVRKINIKDEFVFTLTDGRQVAVPIDKLSGLKRPACNFCDDFTAEYADISFGGLGAENGWTTSIIRSPVGRAVFTLALENVLMRYRFEDNPKFVTQAEEKIYAASARKKAQAEKSRKERENSGVKVVF
ncbi:MAG: Coenzyme F420 hydrogenase/dehydrogenase, beta subunit C-terminal domain [Desulfobacter sp.]|nr:MAG: Coenzyme F420 hydrogenase/dehydrogenase, beta subunit C-terminal domain [Desulfobacter sp.]